MSPIRPAISLTPRQIGLLAALTPVWFWAVYAVMAALRPEFSHLTDAVSELGSVGAPRAWAWNVLGYVLPGLAVSLLGLGLRQAFGDDRRVRLPAYALVVAGAFITLSGVFPGDFEDRTSFTMWMHTAGSLLSFPAFLVAGFSLPRVLRARAASRWAVWPSLALVVSSVLTGVLRSGATPGLGQRLGFACVFLWVGLVGLVLLRAGQGRRTFEHGGALQRGTPNPSV
jgi:hypothetical membrane protein